MQRHETMVPQAEIVRRILTLRGQKVMIDSDLAELYGVTTKRLNEQVRRNVVIFPPDFMFQPSAEEVRSLGSQSATSKGGTRRTKVCATRVHGTRRYHVGKCVEHATIR